VYERALALGYLDKEVEAVLELMEKRGLVDQDPRRGFLREAITQAPSIDELENEIDEWLHDIKMLCAVFPTDKQLRQWQETAEKAKKYVNEQLRKKPDDAELIRRKRGIQQLRQQLISYAQKEHHQLRREIDAAISQLPPLDPRIKKRLENSVPGVVDYALQVNDLRSRMYKRLIKLEGDINQSRQRIQGTKTSLQTEALDYLTLTKLVKETHGYLPTISKLRERHDTFQTEFDQYIKWAELVSTGSALISEIQQWGDLVQEQNQAFEQLSRDIRGHLSASKTDALPDAPIYKMRLDEIAESVRGLKAEATARFTSLQDQYRQILVTQLNFPANQLWSPHQYNPVAPQTAYERLKEDVQRILQEKVCQRLAKTIDDEQRTIRATLQSSLLATLPPAEQTEIQAQGQTLTMTLSDLAARLDRESQRADDLAVISDFPGEGEGEFNALVQSLGQIRETVIIQLHPKVKQLASILREFELTAEEEMVLVAFSNRSDSMELAGLRQHVQRLSEDGLWKALRGLHDKRRINIQITAVHYD
jgi:DNA-binding MarR family transcriptional regulator